MSNLEKVHALEEVGDYIAAADVGMSLLSSAPDDQDVAYLVVRNLARSGATHRARILYQEFHLNQKEDVDSRALAARIEKDLAFRKYGPDRQNGLLRAARMYRTVHEDLGGHYSAINAATLFELAGENDQAKAMAEVALKEATHANDAVSDLDLYYREASKVEALIILGDVVRVMEGLHGVARTSRNNLAARASTRKQLRLLLEAKGINASILQPLEIPKVAHFTGHMITPFRAFDAGGFTEAQVAKAINERLNRHHLGFLYGSLACGSDILFVEAGLQRGFEVHIVLPFGEETFIQQSVAPGGAHWVERFWQCHAQAASVTYASEDPYAGDPQIYAYTTKLAMGLALLRARFLDAEAVQLAVWDGEPATVAGTGYDVSLWREMGRPTDVIDVQRRPTMPEPEHDEARTAELTGAATPGEPQDTDRKICALLFADLSGFSGIREEAMAAFNRDFMQAATAVVDQRAEQILHRNTWGDAYFVVIENASDAAQIAMELHDVVSHYDKEAAGLSASSGFRISLHYGPVFFGPNAFTKSSDVFGSHVTRAARIEPITPVGEVYATEAFAAELEVEQCEDVVAEYVGVVTTAKNYGSYRMYHLTRSAE